MNHIGTRLFLTLPLVLALAHCDFKETPTTRTAAAAAAAGRVLRVFNWGDYIGSKTIQEFERRFNAKVVYDNYSSNEELIARLESGGVAYDVVFPSGYAVEILRRKNLLRPIDKARLTNIGNVMPQFRHPTLDPKLEHAVPYTWSTTGIAYDDRVLTADEASSWKALFSPKVEGQLLVLDDMRAAFGMALKANGQSANATDPAAIAAATDRLIAQKPLVRVYTGANIPDLLARGEVKVAYAWSGDILQAVARNPHLHYAVPREGTLIYVDYMCVTSAAKDPTLAADFINFILEPDVAADIASTTHYAVTNSTARDRVAEDVKRLWNAIPEGSAAGSFEEIRNVGDALQHYDAGWQKLKGSN